MGGVYKDRFLIGVIFYLVVCECLAHRHPKDFELGDVRLRHMRHVEKQISDVFFRSKRQLGVPYCAGLCKLKVANMQILRATFQDLVDEPDTSLVHIKIHLIGYNKSVLEAYPSMANNFRATEWVWASEKLGRKLLGLPHDADVLSFYTISRHRKHLDLHVLSSPPGCMILTSPSCRIQLVRKLLVLNLTRIEGRRHKRDFVCHQVLRNDTKAGKSVLVYRCCDTSEYRRGNKLCQIYPKEGAQIRGVLTIVQLISFVFTLFSPVYIMRMKLALRFDNVTKFFRASLKHGITGQRNYIIRISSRQLVNLSDPKPFSIPRALYRLAFHCYGEGRCCIHWWAKWRHQPFLCRKQSRCRQCWLAFWRYFAISLVYPGLLYVGVALYIPNLSFYTSVVQFAGELKDYNPLSLNLNILGSGLLPSYDPTTSIWMLFSFVAFVYTTVLLSWPNNPLERCLVQIAGRRKSEQTHVLQSSMTKAYKRVLQKLSYGDYATKRHFFRIRWVPWRIRRIAQLIRRILMQIPIINVCFNLTMFDAKLFQIRGEKTDRDRDETQSMGEFSRPSARDLCKFTATFVVWLAFVVILFGYCSTVFLMTELILNLIFFTFLGAVLHAATVLPYLCLFLIIIFYVNDSFSIINTEHKEILKLIDENSPRVTALEDTEDVFRSGPAQILKTHNLGAVKFIDSDNTEYVSKELYYNVCTDLKCGWSRSMRRICNRLTFVLLFVCFVFLVLSALGAFTGHGVWVTVVAVLASAVPKILEFYHKWSTGKDDMVATWAKLIPEILDRHIRVDRTQVVDTSEEEISTYDVRPVGMLELEIPRTIQQRTLRLWKFPWIVSADQQTRTQENFILALANKLAAACFLSKLVTRSFPTDLDDEQVLRQWCLLVENCILEGSAAASSVNGVPVEAVRLFPEEVQQLVAPFSPGTTIDNVVDNINRELYGPYTQGVLVTIGNTTFAMGKLDDKIFAFNSSCHGEQVTDLFGAVLIATDFNTQNLQTTIKFIMDPYSPDAVPVYSIVPTEGFVFRSSGNEIDIEVSVDSPSP